MRACQSGKAWISLPTADGVAHELMECSNMVSDCAKFC
jgi:hypothetical protein